MSSSDDGYSIWDSTEDTLTTTDVSSYSSDRYTSVTKTYTVYDEDGDKVYVELDISSLEEIDTWNQDEYSDESKSYSIYYIVNTLSDSGYLWIKAEDGNEYVTFYIDVEISANY